MFDATFMRWFITASYLVTSLLCCARALSSRQSTPPERFKGAFYYWGILAGICGLLGINKHWQLLSWLNWYTRILAWNQDWYEARRTVQIVLIVAVIVAGLVLFWLGKTILRDPWQAYMPASLGIVFLLVFVIARSFSLHDVDALINYPMAGLRLNWILELGGISFVAVTASVVWLRHAKEVASIPRREKTQG